MSLKVALRITPLTASWNDPDYEYSAGSYVDFYQGEVGNIEIEPFRSIILHESQKTKPKLFDTIKGLCFPYKATPRNMTIEIIYTYNTTEAKVLSLMDLLIHAYYVYYAYQEQPTEKIECLLDRSYDIDYTSGEKEGNKIATLQFYESSRWTI